MIVSPKRWVRNENAEIEASQMDRVLRVSMKRAVTVEDVHSDVRQQWQQAIQTKHGYEGFANFLAEQFSVEVLHTLFC